MAGREFDRAFEQAVASRNQAYLEAKASILEQAREDPAVGKQLHQQAAEAETWEESLAARILLGWAEHRESFERCAPLARGELGGRRKPLGGYTARHRGKAIAQLGSEVTPRVLEMLLKAPESDDPLVESSLFAALIYLGDESAVLPMVALVESPDCELEMRLEAINVLSRLGDPRGLAPLLHLASDQEADPPTRDAAIRGLAGFDDPRAAETLLAILDEPNRPTDEHQAAATALFMLSSPPTKASLPRLLNEHQNPLVLIYLVALLEKIGGEEDLPLLEKLQASEDDRVARAAADAIETISHRP
jgi:HEAT repeat protein